MVGCTLSCSIENSPDGGHECPWIFPVKVGK